MSVGKVDQFLHFLVLKVMPAVAALVSLFTVGGHTVLAQDIQDLKCRMTERTAWGAILDCEPGYATSHDRIQIYTGEPAGWISVGETVMSLSEVVEGAIAYDAGADGTANLVIVLSKRNDGALLADIYDDRSADGKVSAAVTSEGTLAVTEVGPVVQIASLDGWWERKGLMSSSLDILVDGSVRASFSSSVPAYLITDGAPEVHAHIRDLDQDGRPDHEWRQIYLPAGDSSAYVRTEAVVNTQDDEPPISGALLWPYLGDTYSSWYQYAKLSYGASVPPIDVDWAASQVTHVAEFVGSRTEPGNYFLYSIRRLEEGTLSFPDFECPFAFYDLTAGNATLPSLMIRSAYFGPRDPYFLQGTVRHASNDVVYVWRYPRGGVEEAPVWDYKVSLVGSHEYTSVVDIGDLSLTTVAYDRYPYWVTEKTWDFATFVADEGAGSPNSEGISEWGAILEHLAPESYLYVAGWIDNLPLDKFATISEGYRGEVVPILDRPATVYIGSVDRKLHIAGADAGVWNIDGSAELRYRNLDGDAYLDQWQYLENAQLRSQLNLATGYLVYAENDRVSLKRTDMPAMLFEALPPRNHAEWSELGQQLEELRGEFAPGDLASLFQQSAGPAVVMEGASIRGLRAIEDGFRFVLVLGPGFQATSDDHGVNWPPLQERPPGEYVITYHGDGFQVQPLTPPQPQVLDGSMRLSDPQPLELEPVRLEASIYNAGLEDIDNLQVSAVVTGPDSGVQGLGTITVALLAEQAVPVQFDWTPSGPGEWRLALAWGEEGQQPPSASTLNPVSLTAHVAASPKLSVGWILRISHVSQPLALGAFLGALVCIAASLALVLLRKAKEPS